MLTMRFKYFIFLLPLLLSSCNGILSGIYDDPVTETADDYGFVSFNKSDNSGTIYIDATSYSDWVYLDFHNMTVVTLGTDEEEPDSWDIAVHRYDTKTNGATVLETTSTGLDVFLTSGAMPDGDYQADVWTEDTIAIDMSGMMEGNIVYTSSYYNEELSKWLDVDTSNMPPTYTMSHKVYAVCLADGTNLALKLSNYMNSSGTKGHLTIEFVYPLPF